jgi:hypothetical protein
MKPEIVELSYEIIAEELEESKKKGKYAKASAYTKVLEALDEQKANGVDITPEIIENEINKILDENEKELKNTKKQLKTLEKERKTLIQFSERESKKNDDISTIISTINSI